MCNECEFPNPKDITRRNLMRTGMAASAAGMALAASQAQVFAQTSAYADPAESVLPKTEVTVGLVDTALVVVDPLIDFLSPNGVAWKVVGESVTEQGVVPNLSRLFTAAKSVNMTVAISPHYYYPTDHSWQFEGPLEKLMHAIGMFDRKGPLSLDGFDGSGADFMPEFKDAILDGKTIIASPHKVYGPQTNDLDLQLRKHGISKVILAGMSANLCVQSHLYDLLERGYEVAVVRDATAAAKLPEGDGYLAALINFRFVANALWTTDEAVSRIQNAA